MKSLKFRSSLVPLILSGEKTGSWRLFDDKDFRVGDIISLIDSESGKVFAEAEVNEAYTKPFGDVNDDDYGGHERYESRNAMLAEFKEYYGDRAGFDSPLTIIRYSVIKTFPA